MCYDVQLAEQASAAVQAYIDEMFEQLKQRRDAEDRRLDHLATLEKISHPRGFLI